MVPALVARTVRPPHDTLPVEHAIAEPALVVVYARVILALQVAIPDPPKPDLYRHDALPVELAIAELALVARPVKPRLDAPPVRIPPHG